MSPNSNRPRSVPASPTAFERCMVDVDPAVRADGRRVHRRSLGVSLVLECAALVAALVYPLFAPVDLVARREIPIPIPPYGPVTSSQTLHPTGDHTSNGRVITLPVPTDGVRAPIGTPVAHTIGVQMLGATNADLGDSFGPAEQGLLPLSDIRQPASLPVRPRPVNPSPAIVRRSEGVQSAMLIHRVEPVYPPIAKQIHVQGTVQLHAVIARDGSIESLEILSGNALLIQAAREAVSWWRYRPTLLGGDPVEVETYITVIFRLGDN